MNFPLRLDGDRSCPAEQPAAAKNSNHHPSERREQPKVHQLAKSDKEKYKRYLSVERALLW